jgi:hypothetical protein
VIPFLLKHWREDIIATLLVVVVVLFVQRDHRLIASGEAKERTRVADSTLAVVTPQRLKVDTLIVRDTVRVRGAIAATQAIHDTVLHHLTDTLLVKEYVAKTDTALAACSELSHDCAAFRASATQEIAAWKAKANAAPMIVTKSCVAPSVVTGLLAAGAGYLLHRK